MLVWLVQEDTFLINSVNAIYRTSLSADMAII